MKYKNHSFSDKEEVNKLLESNTAENIISAILGSVNGIDDFHWVQSLCLIYIYHKDFWVAKTAINSLGDLARKYREMNTGIITNALQAVENEKLLSTITDTLEDIALFKNNIKDENPN